jgi:hypothetical protein
MTALLKPLMTADEFMDWPGYAAAASTYLSTGWLSR